MPRLENTHRVVNYGSAACQHLATGRYRVDHLGIGGTTRIGTATYRYLTYRFLCRIKLIDAGRLPILHLFLDIKRIAYRKGGDVTVRQIDDDGIDFCQQLVGPGQLRDGATQDPFVRLLILIGAETPPRQPSSHRKQRYGKRERYDQPPALARTLARCNFSIERSRFTRAVRPTSCSTYSFLLETTLSALESILGARRGR